MTFNEMCDYLFKELADRRVYDWPLMSNPLKLLAILIVYLYAIYVYLPNKMNSRNPFKLNYILVAYNSFQVVACILLIRGVVTSGWTTHYTLGCQLVDYSDDEMAVRMARYVWWTLILKMIELIETVFFVLRKKFNQVSPLHVYHHVSTVSLSWLAVKYFAGGTATFTIIANSIIHVLMYTYYLLASVPSMRNRLDNWKPKLTMLQMIQFWVIIVHTSQVLHPDCKYAKIYAYLALPDVSIIFYMFLNFYRKSYYKKVSVTKHSN